MLVLIIKLCLIISLPILEHSSYQSLSRFIFKLSWMLVSRMCWILGRIFV